MSFNPLPQWLSLKLTYSKDVSISAFNLAFGRLLPTLKLPEVDLTGKNAIVTGGNSGIGLQIASDLAQRGATVVIACRYSNRAQTAIDTIHQQIPDSHDRVNSMTLDTSSLASVKAFVSAWSKRTGDDKRVDILCHNAGIGTPPEDEDLTEEGIEIVYATNALGSFLLTHLLEPHLSSTARIVFTSSTGQYSTDGTQRFSSDFAAGPVRGIIEPGFHCPKGRITPNVGEKVARASAARYGNSKAMQCAMARCFQHRWNTQLSENNDDRPIEGGVTSVIKGRGRIAHSFTPGFTSTPIFSKLNISDFWTDPEFTILRATTAIATNVDQGAATGVWLATTEDEGVICPVNGGRYWDRMTRRICDADMYSDELLRRLWQRWERDANIDWPLPQ